MKNTLLFKNYLKAILLFAFIAISQSGFSQVSAYTFAQSSGTFTSITGGTLHGTAVDDVNYSFALPFTFTYNGTGYTSAKPSTNGFLVLGGSAPSTTQYTPLSSGSTNFAVSGFGADLNSTVRSEVLGTTPNRIYVCQWSAAGRYSSGLQVDAMNFQIRLYETSNVIDIVYGTNTGTATSSTVQVGLRGAATTDFNTRTSTTSWSSTTSGGANSSSMTYSSTVKPANGQTYTWTPLVLSPCVTPNVLPTALTFSSVTTTGLSGSFTAASPAPSKYLVVRSTSATAPIPVNGTIYAIGDNLGTGTNVRLASNATAFSDTGLTAGTQYYYYVFSYNDSCTGAPFYSATALSGSQTTVCATATAVAANTITSNSANITWTGSGNYIVEYGATGFTPGTAATAGTGGTIASSNTPSPFTLTGLTATTTYQVYVRQVCPLGGFSANSTVLTITTPQIPAIIPYLQDFSGTNNFSFVNGSQVNKWVNGSATGNPVNSMYISNDAGISNIYTLGTASVTQAYRDIAIPSGTTLTSFSFDWKANGESTYDYLRVWLVPTSFNPSAGTQITSGTGRIQIAGNFGLQTTWQNYSNSTLDLSSFANTTMRLVFEWRNDGSGGTQNPAAIDNVSLTIPSCATPVNAAMTNITTTTATINWTAPATAPTNGYNYEVRTSGAAGSGATGLFVAGTTAAGIVTANITGLTAGTNYSVYVQSNCGAGDLSSWSVVNSFNSACNATNVPYSENFESATVPNLPLCGSVEQAGTGNVWSVQSPNGYGFTSKTLTYVYNLTNPANTWFYTQGINLVSGTSYRISYRYGNTSGATYPEKLKLAYGNAPVNTAMNTILADYPNVVNSTATTATVDFTATSTGIFYFGFQAYSLADQDVLLVDDISIVLAPNSWTGTTSSSWNVATNWSFGTIPDGSSNVEIATNTPNAAVLNVDYTLATGKTLTVSGLGTLTINPINTLTIAGTAVFNDKSITLKSDATGTGSIGQVTGALTGATNVTVERYIAGRRAFRFLSPGVTTTTSIKANWQNAGLPTAGIGTHITGSTTGANGFDQTSSGNPSLHTYNAQVTGTTTGFVAAANTNVATLKAGVGYRLLVRGDRTLDLSLPSTDNMNAATILSSKGTLKTGTVTFNATDAINSPVLINNQSGNTQTNGYTLIGNPYASPVDWNAVTKTGVSNNAYYTWDPTLGTAAQRGRYVVYSADSGLTNLYDDNSVLSQTNRRYLQTGQAVFIKNTDLATPATLTFNEANKAAVNSFVFRTNEQTVTVTGNSSLYLTVYDPNELAIGAAPIDGSVALFGTAYNNALDANDVDKLTTSGENVAFVRGNKNLAIETLAPVVANDELFVKTVQFQANKNYTFKVNTTNFDTAVSAKMVDLYLNTETAIDLTQPSFVTFATTADANSYGADRFKIVFNNTALGNGSFNASAVVIYPNPIANNEFTLALPSAVTGKVTVSLSNMLGQEVYKVSAEATPAMQIQPKQQLEEGVYIVSVTNNGQVLQSKVVVRK